MKSVVAVVLFSLFFCTIHAQGVLPEFSVIERNNKVTISWNNPYQTCIQLNVQRSYDSLKYFRTIYSATSPGLPQNGFTEAKQPYAKTFYRIFYVLEGGNYFFTPAKLASQNFDSRSINLGTQVGIATDITKMITVDIKGDIKKIISSPQFGFFKDSILRQTKDTLFAINDTLVEVRRFVAKEVWKPSVYVYTDKVGYLNISLRDAAQKKYLLKFFEENGTPLFEIKQVKESQLTLDKSNFVHAGWFMFELYEDNKLKEKSKFYLPKDF